MKFTIFRERGLMKKLLKWFGNKGRDYFLAHYRNDVRNQCMTNNPITRERTMDDTKEMPRYKCHKEVHALKIDRILTDPEGGLPVIVPEGNYTPFEVTHEWFAKHEPTASGYYVLYEDGYASYSPAKAFEEGYTLRT